MLDRIKRRLSRTKSVVEEELPDKVPKKNHTLSPSVEELISGITFTEGTSLESSSLFKAKSRPKHTFPTLIENNSERTVFNNVESGFLALPTEVLLFLQAYLRPSSEVALRHTCSRFFLLFSLPSFYLSGEERFEFCCMTERDQDPSKLSRLVCGVCRDLHPRSSFPSAEVHSAPLARDCRQVWLCAHKSLGYQRAVKTIKAGAEAPFRAQNLEPCSRCRETVRSRSIADRPEKGTSTIDLESDKAQALLITKIAILQAPTPSYNTKTTSGSSSYREVFAVKDVVAALQAVDFRICPHIKLGDPYILSKFCRSCINTVKLPQGIKGPPCISETRREFGDPDYLGKCKQACFSRHCKTKFMFQTRESPAADASGQRQIWLIICVYRWLGPLQSAGSEKTWQSHAVDHKERVEMRGKWEQWDKTVKVRRVMPNWEICLLHPEDCQVRS